MILAALLGAVTTVALATKGPPMGVPGAAGALLGIRVLSGNKAEAKPAEKKGAKPAAKPATKKAAPKAGK
jgi:hypothetical protein